MKKFKILILLPLLLFSGSCKKYLTVEPAAQSTATKVFGSTQGFTDALIGTYITMRKNYSPNAFMISGSIDYMAQEWYGGTSLALSYQFVNHNYTDTQADAATGNMFLFDYNTIANVNLLIEALSTQTVLTPANAKLIEGEARGIRAFIHFDLIRLFGPMPGNIGTKTYLPYVTTKSKELYPYDTYANYMIKLNADLDKAEQLLVDDPITKSAPASLNTASGGYRQNRMNYYAVLGLQARVKLWMGDKTNALRYAKMAIDANDGGTKKFTFGLRSGVGSTLRNYVMFTEHLFGLNCDIYNDASSSTASNAAVVQEQTKVLNGLYEGESTDLRYFQLYSLSSSTYFTGRASSTKKYTEMNVLVGNPNPFSIPLIRLSEMYLIASECAAIPEANVYFSAYRTAKEASALTLTETNRTSVLAKEYLKEFYAEGQAFFMYKRFAIQNMLWSNHDTGEAQYVLPLPTVETGGTEQGK